MNRRLTPEEVAQLTGGRVSAEEAKARTDAFKSKPTQTTPLAPTSYGDKNGQRELCQTFDRAKDPTLKQALDVATTSESLQNRRWDRLISEADGTSPAPPPSGGPGCN